MQKNRVVRIAGVLAIGVFALPSLTFAAGLTAAQVQAILGLLQSFGAGSATIANVQSALTGQSAPASSASCVNLSMDLYSGETDADTGGQVSQLQSFLGVSPATGYYGPETEQAVKTYQASHGIVSSGSPDTTGYGFVGPQTRASMACASVTNNLQPQPETQPQPIQPEASIDQSSMTTTSDTPTITGTASGGVTAVGVNVGNGGYVALQATNVPVTNGQWSASMQKAPSLLQFVPGQSYQVTVYDNSGGKGGGNVLAAGTLTYNAPSSAPLSAACSGSPYLSGGLGISWSVTPTGGSGNYSYQWSLDDGASAGSGEGGVNSSAVLATYGTSGTKTASVTVNDGNSTVTANCSATIVGTNSNQAAASIDISSQTQTAGPVTITGTASGAAINDGVAVFLVPPSDASYGSNYNLLSGQLGKDGVYESSGNGALSGQWYAEFSYVPAGSYVAIVYDGVSKALLDQATVTVEPASVAGSSITNFSLNGTNGNLTVPVGTQVSITWNSTNTTGCTINYGGTVNEPSNSSSPLVVNTSGAVGSYTYNLTCTGANGQTVTASRTLSTTASTQPQTCPSGTTGTYPNCTAATTASPTGLITSSPSQTTDHPVLYGTATNAQYVTISAVSNSDGKQYAWNDWELLPVTNGSWSAPASYYVFPNGSYTVQLYAATWPNASGVSTKTLLQTAALAINVPQSSSPTAALDQPTQTASTGYPVISGTANVPSVYVNFVQNGNSVSGTGATSVTNGHWSAGPASTLPPLANGTYTLQVYDTATNALLTTGTLTVTVSNAAPLATISAPDCTLHELYANNPNFIGCSVTYSWDITDPNAGFCSIYVYDSSGKQVDGSGAVQMAPGSGSQVLSMDSAGNYFIKIVNAKQILATSSFTVYPLQ